MMKSWINRAGYHESVLKKLIQTEDSTPLPPPVLDDYLANWMAQVTLLYGVPVEYMVADHRMLPEESIRFFYMDRNWMDRMLDGVLSAGVLSTKELVFNSSFFASIYAQVDAAQLKVRTELRGETAAAVEEVGGTISGLLMRSTVVSDYPGVEINGYDEAGQLLKILRMDRLSDSLLICLFDGVPAQVEFVQPSEGLHFGVQLNEETGGNYIYLRGLGFPNETQYPGGKQIQDPPGSEQYVTAPVDILSGDSAGVLNVEALAKNIQEIMQALPDNPLKNPETGADKLTAGGFAIQMVVTAGVQPYKITTPDGGHPPACGTTNS